MNIVLIGYRGVGKSTIGKQLAGRMGMDFVDTDELIMQRSGKTIREIFEQGGEPLFRDLESAVIDDLVESDNAVIAAGGGVVLRKANVEKLQANGRIVWLQAPVDVIWKRLQSNSRTPANRPNMTSAGGLEEILRLQRIRDPQYTAAADVALDITNMSADDIVDYLAKMT
ncbi:MAG: shikimate kinase [Phycisphaerae bacterium]